MTADTTNSFTPPYIAFKTLMNLIQRLEDEPIPPRIDRTFLGTMSGGYQTQIIAALRALDFVDDDGTVRPLLMHFVTGEPSDRQSILSEFLSLRYGEAVALGEKNGTQGQLEEAFDVYGVSGSTKRKAIGFFLKAAEEAGVTLSAHFRVPRASPARTRRRTSKNGVPPAVVEGLDEEPDDDGGSMLSRLRARYIELLMNRIEEEDQLDDALLDRLEGLLGFMSEEEA